MRKPWIAASGAPTRGPLRSSRKVRLRGGQPDDMQGQAARRDESLRALVEQVAVDERVGDEPLQVLRRLPLHAGGDFFAEEFEEKVGHHGNLNEARVSDGATPSPLAGEQAALSAPDEGPAPSGAECALAARTPHPRPLSRKRGRGACTPEEGRSVMPRLPPS